MSPQDWSHTIDEINQLAAATHALDALLDLLSNSSEKKMRSLGDLMLPHVKTLKAINAARRARECGGAR